ncbi:GntR family transcriptional regulator [Ornithinimicrobium faecis]|uniref:GntR family transcriptional regulator n=1 Tax=Ornithinimicrobium faecis TaxID=2934158 RepID=UPI0021179469|nr:GntR family transcriptional regulator [Ornithinimicrobium sp. HY1745]
MQSDATGEPEGLSSADRLLSGILGISDRVGSLPGTIALAIARDIIEARLKPGDDLNSIDLAKRFDSSRTPVREGLMTLERAGLVTTPARRRPRVSTLQASQIEDIYEVRARLLGFVGERITENAHDVDLQLLDRELAIMRQAVVSGDGDGYFWANVSFHEVSATIARNEALKRSIDSLGGQVLRLRHVSLTVPGRIQSSFADHERLMRAYRERNAMLASALNHSIVVNALQVLKDISEESLEI